MGLFLVGDALLINLLFGWSDSDSEFAGGVIFLVHNEDNIIN